MWELVDKEDYVNLPSLTDKILLAVSALLSDERPLWICSAGGWCSYLGFRDLKIYAVCLVLGIFTENSQKNQILFKCQISI